MKMQRQHFEAIARIIAEELPHAFDSPQWTLSNSTYRDQVARSFADVLKTTNPNFDFERFMLACDVEPDADVMNQKAEYVMGDWIEQE